MLLMVLALACGEAERTSPPPPDILLITLDTLRADRVGVYTAGDSATPHLDTVAAAGVQFQRAYTVTPLTIPAHSSLFTGLYPPRHGVRDNGDYFLSEDAQTLAESLKEAGYATMAAVGAEVTSHHWGFSQGFDAYFDDLGPGDRGNRWAIERPGSEVVADVIPWWTSERAAPRFAWVHMFDVHHPYTPREPWASMYPNQPYLAEVAGVDALVGELLEVVGDDTIVVIAADHGEGLGDHGERLHGILLYDATTRIPLLVRGPGIAPQVSDVPVSLVDVMPTLLGLAGLPVPEGLDGTDLSQALRGGEWPADKVVYVESLYPLRHYGWAAQYAHVDPDYKLIGSKTDKLFARKDRRERKNLASQPALYKPRRHRLTAAMEEMKPEGTAEKVSANEGLVSQLEALGYMTAAVQEVEDPPDPEDRIPSLQRLETLREHLRAEDYAAVVETARALLADEPGLSEPRATLATALLRLGQVEEAREILVEELARQERSSLLTQLGVLELQSGNWTVALTHLERAVEMDVYQASSWIPYLHALFITNNPRLFAESDRAMGLLPEQPGIYGMRGLALEVSGQPGAETLLRQALAADPELPMLRVGLARILRSRDDVPGAMALLEEEQQRWPKQLPARRLLVEIHAAEKAYDRQIAVLDSLVVDFPKDPTHLHSRAQARFNLGQFQAAYEDITRCRTLAPTYPGCAMLEANCLKKLGRDDEAQRAYEEALRLAAPDQ